jgi:hypothetical protein
MTERDIEHQLLQELLSSVTAAMADDWGGFINESSKWHEEIERRAARLQCTHVWVPFNREPRVWGCGKCETVAGTTAPRTPRKTEATFPQWKCMSCSYYSAEKVYKLCGRPDCANAALKEEKTNGLATSSQQREE